MKKNGVDIRAAAAKWQRDMNAAEKCILVMPLGLRIRDGIELKQKRR